MSSKKSERYQSATEMKAALGAGGSEEEATIIGTENEKEKDIKVVKIDDQKPKRKIGLTYAACAIVAVVLVVASYMFLKPSPPSVSSSPSEVENVVTPVASNPTLTLSCKTSGASLYVDGKKKGTGKWSGELSAGSHKLEARLDGYQTESETLVMSEGGAYSHIFPALTAVPTKSETTTSTVSNNSTSTESSGKINGYEYVDLGLSVKWATCNVGANSPTEYGNYYAWGETNTKDEYTVENSTTYGRKIGNIDGDSFYDAAHANWGGTWRLPTEKEFDELINNCESEWTTQLGVKGRKFTSEKNGKSVFFPAAGWREQSSLNSVGEEGVYWTSSHYEILMNIATLLWIDDSGQETKSDSRIYGQSIRPVSK